jgi:hypothetical protein
MRESEVVVYLKRIIAKQDLILDLFRQITGSKPIEISQTKRDSYRALVRNKLEIQ